jgi:hypothetical protein
MKIPKKDKKEDYSTGAHIADSSRTWQQKRWSNSRRRDVTAPRWNVTLPSSASSSQRLVFSWPILCNCRTFAGAAAEWSRTHTTLIRTRRGKIYCTTQSLVESINSIHVGYLSLCDM